MSNFAQRNNFVIYKCLVILLLVVIVLIAYVWVIMDRLDSLTEQMEILVTSMELDAENDKAMMEVLNTHSEDIAGLGDAILAESEIMDERLIAETSERKQADAQIELQSLSIDTDLRNFKDEFDAVGSAEAYYAVMSLAQDLADTICKWHPGDWYCYHDIYRPEERESAE